MGLVHVAALVLTLATAAFADTDGADAEMPASAVPPQTEAPAEPPPPAVPEQERQPLPTPSQPLGISDRSSSDSGSWMLQTLTALAIVIGLIFAVRAVLVRLTGTSAGVGANRLVEVLARATIGHKTQVIFLKIHQRVIVAAQTPAGMDTLTTLDDPEEVAWLLGQIEAAKPLSITESFRQVMQRSEREFTADETGHDTSEQYVDRTRDQLSGLLARIRHLKDPPPPGSGDR